MLTLTGILLQLMSVASIVAAVVLFLLKDSTKAFDEPAPEESNWFRKPNLRALVYATTAALASRALLVILAYGVLALVNTFGSPDIKQLLAGYGYNKLFPPMESLFSHWDAPHYLDIARLGYTADKSLGDQWLFIVFYPLYPALTALIKPLLGSEFSAATAISWACLAGACYWLYRLSLLDNDRREARRAVKYLLIFPAAVFLGAPYTESLFLLLTVLSLYALRKNCWWLAGLMGFLAALTRNLGVLLVLPFAVELFTKLGIMADLRKFKSGKVWKDLLKQGCWVLLIPLGLAAYLLINQAVYGNPFMFLKIQNDHWGQHTQPIWSTVLSTWNYLTGNETLEVKLYLWGPQMAGMAAMLIALPFMVRRLRPSYAAYLIVYVFMALTPSWLLSFNRYMMGAVPLFIGIAAMTRKRWVDNTLTVIFVALMLFLAAGYMMWKQVV